MAIAVKTSGISAPPLKRVAASVIITRAMAATSAIRQTAASDNFPLGSTALTGPSPAYTYRLAELRSPKLPPTGSCCVQRPNVQWSHEHWWETSHDLYFALWNLTLNQGYNIKECGKYLFQARLWYNKVYSLIGNNLKKLYLSSLYCIELCSHSSGG